MFSGTTISYHQMQAGSDQLTSSIFQLHIENFTKTLQLMSTLLFTFFGVSIIFDTFNIMTNWSNDYLEFGMWIFKQLVNMLGILTAIFCIIAVRLQSRGSSLKFSKMITIFSEIYVIYLIIEYILSFDEIYEKMNKEYTLTKIQVIYYVACLLLVLMFFLRFFIGKSRQYHTIVTQAILDNTKRSMESLDGPLRFNNLV